MRRPALWIALLRVTVGALLVHGAWSEVTVKWLWGAVPVPSSGPAYAAGYANRVSEAADRHPLGWYRRFLQTTVRPHSDLFASAHVWAGLMAGVGLVLGCLTALAALLGLALAIGAGLATYWTGPLQLAFWLLLSGTMIVFLGARAGRSLGIDTWLARSSRGRGPLRWLV